MNLYLVTGVARDVMSSQLELYTIAEDFKAAADNARDWWNEQPNSQSGEPSHVKLIAWGYAALRPKGIPMFVARQGKLFVGSKGKP